MNEEEQLYEDLLITALEQGSSYWCSLPDLTMVPRGPDALSIRIYQAVMNGVNIPIADTEDHEPLGVLTKTGIERAITLMSSVSKISLIPEAYHRIKSGDWDAADADAWFQFVVMGKIVYG